MSIHNISVKEVCCVSEDSSLFEAAKYMKDDNVGAVVVVKNKESDLTPVGILTDRDLVTHLLADNVDPKSISVVDVITQGIATANESFSVQETVKVMKEKGVRRLPIVNDENKVTGIISMDDLLILLIEELCCLSEVIKKQKD